MYTTKQFDKDVEELRRLIKMCDELIERQDRHTETLRRDRGSQVEVRQRVRSLDC